MKNSKSFLFSAAVISSFTVNAQGWIEQPAGISYNSQTVCVADISAPTAQAQWAILTDFSSSMGAPVIPVVIRTTDGGNFWLPNILAGHGNHTPGSICALDAQVAWIAMFDAADEDEGQIYKTVDGGVNWTLQASADFQDAARFVHFFNANEGIAVGDSSVFTTTNGGTSWTRGANIPVQFGGATEFLFNAYEVKGNTIWLGDVGGWFYKSTDKGLSWTRSTTNLYPYSIKGIAFKDATNGLAIGARWAGGAGSGGNFTDDGLIFKTTDGGLTWSQLSYNIVGNTMTSVVQPQIVKYDVAHLPGTNNTYVISSEAYSIGYSAISHDGGASWQIIDSNVRHTALAFRDSSTGWSGGYLTSALANGVYKWIPPVTTPVDEVTAISLAADIYPNPVSESLNLVIPVGSSSTYTYSVSVIDVRGSETKWEVPAAGSDARIQLETARLSPGLYLIRVRAEGKVFVGKFIKS